MSRPPEWPKWTDLVGNADGQHSHSSQIPEIQACLSSAVRRANSKLVLINGFPDVKTKGQWLSSALKTELNERRAESQIIQDVNARAECDKQYFRSLCLMVSLNSHSLRTRTYLVPDKRKVERIPPGNHRRGAIAHQLSGISVRSLEGRQRGVQL
jgi:hypothetical protein